MRTMGKGMDVAECVEHAEHYLEDAAACLLLFDVKDSRNAENRQQLHQDLQGLLDDLNQEFAAYLPNHNLVAPLREESGFNIIYGDGGAAGINEAEIIPEIVAYQEEHYEHVPLYWGVAKDWTDPVFDELLK